MWGTSFEGMVKHPADRPAPPCRVVGWHKEDAGFIDNEPYSHTFSNANVRAGLSDPALLAEAADHHRTTTPPYRRGAISTSPPPRAFGRFWASI